MDKLLRNVSAVQSPASSKWAGNRHQEGPWARAWHTSPPHTDTHNQRDTHRDAHSKRHTDINTERSKHTQIHRHTQRHSHSIFKAPSFALIPPRVSAHCLFFRCLVPPFCFPHTLDNHNTECSYEYLICLAREQKLFAVVLFFLSLLSLSHFLFFPLPLYTLTSLFHSTQCLFTYTAVRWSFVKTSECIG